MKEKTLLFVVDTFQIGGAIAFMEQHARVAARLGHSVTVLGAKGNIDDPGGMFPYARVTVLPVKVGYGAITGRIKWSLRMLSAIRAVQRRYDVVLFYSRLIYSFFTGLFSLSTWRVPRIYAFCGDVSLEVKSAHLYAPTWIFLFKAYVMYLIQLIVLMSATKVITFSKYAKSLLLERYRVVRAENVTIIPGHVRVKQKSANRVKQPLSLLTISRFEPRKGIDNLLYAVALLKKRGVKFHLTIAGAYESTYLNYFFEIYERLNLFTHVNFLHKVSQDQISELLNDADLFVVPSKDLETFGMMTIMALSHGVPVIGTPTGATPEILAPIENRLITQSIAPESIARSIQWFVSLQKKQRMTLVKKIHQTMQSEYDQPGISKKITAVFISALGKGVS